MKPLLTALELGMIRRKGALAGIYSQVGEQCGREPPGSSGWLWVRWLGLDVREGEFAGLGKACRVGREVP